MKTKLLSSSGVRVSINKLALQKEIFGKGGAVISRKIRPIIQKNIDEAQQEMVDAFEEHPVTKEIRSGETSTNSSGLLGGYGNLFSFIGFEKGDNQITPMSNILKRKITFIVKNVNRTGKYDAVINAPSKSELEEIAQVSWMGGRSWIDGIEKGIAGLNRYLYDPSYSLKNSSSGTGIQTENKIRSVTQTRTPYVSRIISDFKKRLNRL